MHAMMLTEALLCREQTVYKISAIAASAAVIALAVGAVHYRFMWHMKQGHEFPTAEALATFCLTIGGIVSLHFFCGFAWHHMGPQDHPASSAIITAYSVVNLSHPCLPDSHCEVCC